MKLFDFTPGTTALLVSVPHAGTYVPPAIAARLTDHGRTLPDTDWHVEKLYAGAPALGAGLIVATHARVVIDLNRDPSGKALYAGASNTELVPTTTFHDQPLWRDNGPTPDEIQQRVATYWRPYHDQIAAEMARLKAKFGLAVLWDGHSIVSEAPRFFKGKLPDLNLGTADGASCAPDLAARVFAGLQDHGFSAVHNGRFKGGAITRAFGRPIEELHALQLEMAMSAYMDERPPYPWDAARAQKIEAVILGALREVIAWSLDRSA